MYFQNLFEVLLNEIKFNLKSRYKCCVYVYHLKVILKILYFSSRELNIFPLREFYKDQNKWKSEGAMSGKYSRWIRTSQPSCNSFSHQRNMWSCVTLMEGRFCVFCWLIPDVFCWVLLSVDLIGNRTCWNLCFGFPEGAHNRHTLPILPYTQHHFLWMKTGLWCGWWYFTLLAPQSLPFYINAQYPLFIACHHLF